MKHLDFSINYDTVGDVVTLSEVFNNNSVDQNSIQAEENIHYLQ